MGVRARIRCSLANATKPTQTTHHPANTRNTPCHLYPGGTLLAYSYANASIPDRRFGMYSTGSNSVYNFCESTGDPYLFLELFRNL